MPSTKPTAKRSGTISGLLKRKRIATGLKRRSAAAKPARAQWTLAKLNAQVEKDLKSTAAKAKDDAAFRLYVRTALNGDTDKVTGWKIKQAEV